MEFKSAYDLLAPQRIVFGWGRRREVGRWARTLGTRAFVVSGSRTLESSGQLGTLYDDLREAGVEVVELGVISREPLVEDVDTFTGRIRAARADTRDGDVVIGIGGGAAIDLAKAVSAMATNTGSATVKDYLEGVGAGLQLNTDPLPTVAVPTTAGTGSEATKNGVISNHEPPFKKSLRSDRMVPRVAIVDPELSVSLPPETTAHTGMDALTQLIESYISRRAQPIPQALALEGLRVGAPCLSDAVHNGSHREVREAMAHAALLSGLALANSGLGMAHGVAPALGIHCDVPHGLACAVMLPATLRANLGVRERELATVGEILTGRRFTNQLEAARYCVEKIEELCENIGIPSRLGSVGVSAVDIPAIVKSSRGNSMNGNPREISDEELTTILEGML